MSECYTCDTEAEWVWYNGMWSGGTYCAPCMRDRLKPEDKLPAYDDPITTRENVTKLNDRTVVISAGAQPVDSRFPTIRSQEAFDEYLAEMD